ncbi:MAG: SHOCT domain-containing protein [Candidatus Methylomirabilales bacterium]
MNMPEMMGQMMGTWGMAMMVLNLLAGLLLLGLLIVGIVVGVQWLLGRGPHRAPEAETPLDILKRRYARGELSKEEFEAMKRDVA